MAHKMKSRSQFSGRDRNKFKIYVKLEPTDEVFVLKNVYNEMKISELKDYMEFATGVPINLQRLSYLDEGDLLEHTDIRSNDIVPGATLLMKVWSQWRQLVEAVSANDEEWVFNLGVTYPSEYKTPNSEYMTKRSRKAWFEERAFVALSIAAHRGHANLCIKLVEAGANLSAVSPLGRTPLHIAAARGRGPIVDLLLEKGADIDAEDNDGNTALAIADSFGHKSCERHLFLFRWQQRAKKLKPSREVPLWPHQYFDSKFPVWKTGKQSQMYYTNIVPPEEFEGTSLNSPKKRPHPGEVRRAQFHEVDKDFVEIHIKEFDRAHAVEHVEYGRKRLPSLKVDGKMTQKLDKAFAFYNKQERGDLLSVRPKPPSHDQWLDKIKEKEKQEMEEKKRERDLKRQAEEDRKRMEEDKAGNYETWLAQKEAERKKASPSPKGDKGQTQDKKDKNKEKKGPGALRLYLRSLGKDRTGQPYEEWLEKKELELLGRARSGESLFSF